MESPTDKEGQLIKAGLKAVPALRYALGLAAIAAIIKAALDFGLTPAVLVFGILVAVALMIVLFLFTRIVQPKSGSMELRLAASMLLWVSLALALASLVCLFWGVFFGKPVDLRKYLRPPVAVGEGDDPVDLETPRLSGKAGQWLTGTYLDCRVSQPVRGTLVAEESYDVKMELRNRTSTLLQISQVITQRYNPEVARLIGLRSDKIFVQNDLIPKYLEPNQTIVVTARGNQLLPKTMLIHIFHSLSPESSTFEIDLGGIQVPLAGPRKLPASALTAGSDGLDSARLAWEKAKTWSDDAYLVTAFPASSETYWDTATGLKYLKPKSWGATFYSRTIGKLYMTLVSPSGIKGDEVENTDEIRDSAPIPFPKIGSMRALDIVNQRQLAYGDWTDFRIEQIKVNDHWTYGWHLPYRGRDSLPITIDAFSGELIDSLPLGVVPSGSTTTEVPKNPGASADQARE